MNKWMQAGATTEMCDVMQSVFPTAVVVMVPESRKRYDYDSGPIPGVTGRWALNFEQGQPNKSIQVEYWADSGFRVQITTQTSRDEVLSWHSGPGDADDYENLGHGYPNAIDALKAALDHFATHFAEVKHTWEILQVSVNLDALAGGKSCE